MVKFSVTTIFILQMPKFSKRKFGIEISVDGEFAKVEDIVQLNIEIQTMCKSLRKFLPSQL